MAVSRTGRALERVERAKRRDLQEALDLLQEGHELLVDLGREGVPAARGWCQQLDGVLGSIEEQLVEEQLGAEASAPAPTPRRRPRVIVRPPIGDLDMPTWPMRREATGS